MTITLSQLLLAAAFLGLIFAKPFDDSINSNNIDGYAASRTKQSLLTLREACLNHSGSEEGFQQFLLALPTATRCLMSHIDLPQMSMDLKMMTKDNRKEVFETYCPKFAESKACFDDIFQAMATCFAQNVKTARELFGEMFSGAVDLVCKNDGEIFFKARKPEFRSCMSDVKQHIKDCKSTKIATATPWDEYGREECSELLKARDCLHDKASTCDAVPVMDIADIFYNPIFKLNNCLKVPASATDDQGVVHDSWNEV